MRVRSDLPVPDGYRLLHLDEIDSTNDEAKRLAAAGEPAGLIVLADRQSAGRGRRGRNWASPKGNLYCSFLPNNILLSKPDN